jgi:Ca-activated chloride channel family protein
MRSPADIATFMVAVALLVAAAVPAAAQPTFRSDSGAVVSIFATVIDQDNRLVTDLTREDFEVLDNNQPQVLTVFENETQPITVVLMLDTSASMTANMRLLFDAAEQFLIRLLPGDKAKVGAFNDKIEMSGYFTADRDELISEVRSLDYGNATRLYDAMSMSLDELADVEGRRVLVILSDGEDTSSRVGLRTVMDRARDEEVMVYSIGLASEYFDGTRLVRSRPDGGLRRIAEETGGGYFELKRTAELAPTFTRVAQELHSQYVLGFVASRLDNRVHRLTLKVKQPGMSARGRRSYLASGDDQSSGE